MPGARELATIVSKALGLPEALAISYNRIPPGAALGLHSDSATQTIVTLAGQAEFYVQDHTTRDVHQLSLGANSIIHLEPGTSHAVENIADTDRWSLVVSH